MAVKVMGITAGRKDSNSEILLKEALMYCEEAAAHAFSPASGALGAGS